MKALFPKVLGEARQLLSSLAWPMRQPRGMPVAAEWPAASSLPAARRRSADASRWSPRGPSGDWKRRSLDRFGDDRRG